MYNRLDSIPACDRRMNRQTDILPWHRPSPCYAYASRSKNNKNKIMTSSTPPMYLVSDNCFSDFVFLTERHCDMSGAEELFHGAGVRREFALCQWLHCFTHPASHTHLHTHLETGFTTSPILPVTHTYTSRDRLHCFTHPASHTHTSYTSTYIAMSLTNIHSHNSMMVTCGHHLQLMGKRNYTATSNNTKLVHWPLMGGLLHLVQ